MNNGNFWAFYRIGCPNDKVRKYIPIHQNPMKNSPVLDAGNGGILVLLYSNKLAISFFLQACAATHDELRR